MINNLRFYIKLALVLLLVVVFLLTTSTINLIPVKRSLKLKLCTKITSFLCRIMLQIFNVNARADRSKINSDLNGNYLIISNHLSYLDTFIIASKINSVFVASVDGHQEKFPVGLITKNSGGIFVERKSKTKVVKDLQKITDMLMMGFNVVLFPEGTTSDGSGVLPFKTPFFYSANEKSVKILPICINYKKINNLDITKENKHLVFFFEEISFIQHFLRLLKLKRIDVDLKFETVVPVKNYSSRKDVAKVTYEKILSVYEPKSS